MEKSSLTNAELMKFDGKPSWGSAFPQAMQHVLAMLIGNITPPMLIAGICGMTAEEEAFTRNFARFVNERNVQSIMEELETAQRDIGQNVNAKFVFFDLALKMAVLLIQ